MPLTAVHFEGIRCFRDEVVVPLAPLTLLIGENSTGKTTCLALTRLVWDLLLGHVGRFDFNEEPFPLGAYDQVATYRGGRGGLARTFILGGAFQPRRPQDTHRADSSPLLFGGRFVASEGQATLDHWHLRSADATLVVEREELLWRMRLEQPSSKKVLENSGVSVLHPRLCAEFLREREPVIDRLLKPLTDLRMRETRPHAFAPVRTRPQRTYDPVTEAARAEGSHVPMVLARMRTSDAEAWRTLRESLSDFGRKSGLFELVDVQRKGRKESDPFQIRVKVDGPAFNIVDVGYGVSQVLPLLVDCQRSPPGATFLLQQPEVHLHPRAQAALGTWLGTSAKLQGRHYLVETHSDHLVDRVRMDVRDGRHLRPEDVAILYFERRSGVVSVTRLELDARGDFKNAPVSYRSFFLEEERRLLMGPSR
jgi:hypothetical protein